MERERERYFPGDFSVNFHGDSSSPLLLLDDLLVSAVDGAAVVVVFCYLCSVYSPLALSRSIMKMYTPETHRLLYQLG